MQVELVKSKLMCFEFVFDKILLLVPISAVCAHQNMRKPKSCNGKMCFIMFASLSFVTLNSKLSEFPSILIRQCEFKIQLFISVNQNLLSPIFMFVNDEAPKISVIVNFKILTCIFSFWLVFYHSIAAQFRNYYC